MLDDGTDCIFYVMKYLMGLHGGGSVPSEAANKMGQGSSQNGHGAKSITSSRPSS